MANWNLPAPLSAFDALVTAAKALEDEAVELEVAGRPIAAQAKLQQAKTIRNEAECRYVCHLARCWKDQPCCGYHNNVWDQAIAAQMRHSSTYATCLMPAVPL